MRRRSHKHAHGHRAAPAARRRILLLDDDVDWCEVLKAVLDWYDYDVTIVHRGVEAVREIMARDYDAIICDMMLPTMPGDMFYVAVQQLKPHLCKRFIFVTAHHGCAKVDAFLRIAGGLVLYKPLATDELVAKIGQIIAKTDAMVAEIVAAAESEAAAHEQTPECAHTRKAEERDGWLD